MNTTTPPTTFELERMGDVDTTYCDTVCKFPCDYFGYCWRRQK